VILLKSPLEIEAMRASGRVVGELLEAFGSLVAPGITTLELDRFARDFIGKRKGKPTFLGYRGYPASICASVGCEVVHGIPGKRKLLEGEIISIDVGVTLDGWVGDAARTYPVGRIQPDKARLLEVTRRSLQLGIEQARAGNQLGDIGHAVQSYAEANGFSVVRDYVGHGVGKNLHESPQVPNYGKAGTGIKLKAGMTLAIEPMINMGGWETKVLDDGWTVVTADGSLSAHFEDTIAISERGPEVLTAP
jgi:methionyl aminopeptidase